MNCPIGLEVLRIPLIPRIGERRFRKVFLKKTQKKFLSRPIQIVFCDWTAHLLIMYNMLATAQCPEMLFLYLVNCCVINSGKILASHAKVFCRLCERQTMEQVDVNDLSL